MPIHDAMTHVLPDNQYPMPLTSQRQVWLVTTDRSRPVKGSCKLYTRPSGWEWSMAVPPSSAMAPLLLGQYKVSGDDRHRAQNGRFHHL